MARVHSTSPPRSASPLVQLGSASLPPPVVHDVDASAEAELRQLRRGSGAWLVVVSAAFVVAILAGFGLASRADGPTKHAAIAARSTEDRERVLEAERQIRAARGQGTWVELEGDLSRVRPCAGVG